MASVNDIGLVLWIVIGLAVFFLVVLITCICVCVGRRYSSRNHVKRQQMQRNESEHFVWRRQDKGKDSSTTPSQSQSQNTNNTHSRPELETSDLDQP